MNILKPRLSDAETIFNHWNRQTKNIKHLSTHKSPNTLSFLLLKKSNKRVKISQVIQEVLHLYSKDTILQAIKNYTTIFNNNKIYFYHYNFKSLDAFLLSNKGIPQFRQSASPLSKFKREKTESIFDTIRKTTNFLTIQANPQSPLDLKANTYMSVSLEFIKNVNIEGYYKDLIIYHKHKKINYSYFNWIEECIITLIYRKTDTKKLKELVKLHKIYKNKFAKRGV